MHRIDEDGNVDNQFVEGNPSTGQAATRVGADWLNAVQEELANAIEAAEVELNKEDNTQLAAIVTGLEAIRKLLAPRVFAGTTATALGLHDLELDGQAHMGPDGEGGGVDGTLNVRSRFAGAPAVMLLGLGEMDDKGVLEIRVGGVGPHLASDVALLALGGTAIVGKSAAGIVGVQGEASGGGTGVVGKAGSTAGIGVHGVGQGSGVGVVAEGGTTGAPLRVIPSATPGAHAEGAIYFDTSTKKLRVYTGSGWEDLH